MNISPSSSPTALPTALLLAASLALLAGCESTTIIEGSITLTPSAAPTTAAPLLVIIDGGPSPIADWSPVGRAGSDADAPFTPGTLTYRYEWQQFGRAAHDIYVAAFVDVNANGVLDVGEPYGVWAKNPMVDPAFGETAPANYADLVIAP